MRKVCGTPRCALFEAEGTLLVIPFENVKYFQLYPAPDKVAGHTYIKGATVTGYSAAQAAA